MKVIFVSNFFNHHQSAISDALWEKTEGQFAFVETSPMPPEQRQLGYHSLQRPYLLDSLLHEEQVARLIREADVMIAGAAPESLVRRRVKTGKLMFRYSERPLKNGLELWKYLPRLLRWHWRNPGGKPIYLLCASAYAAGDYAKFGLFRGRSYQWGYFPEAKQYENPGKMIEKKDPRRILWCGRFLPLKHADDALWAAKRLKEEGYAFRLDFIGRGEMEEPLKELTREWALSDCVRFLGSMNPEQVRENMENAGIYLFTSDRQEGWGAVLNESMNSGCAVIAGHAIGAVPFLIRDGENGLIYESENREMLYEKLRFLLDHPEEQARLGANACDTIVTQWNADTAAQRLIALSERILAGESGSELYKNGPCSPAKEMQDDWNQMPV